jgi:hypothetical protein
MPVQSPALAFFILLILDVISDQVATLPFINNNQPNLFGYDYL